MEREAGLTAALVALVVASFSPAAAGAVELQPQGSARPQLEATAADGNARTHFDGADSQAQPLVGDLSVDAGGQSSKASADGTVYLKPERTSTKISAPPKPPSPQKVDTDPRGPRDLTDAIGGGMVGLGSGVLLGLMMGGLPGALIGGLLGAAVGGGLGFFF